MLQQKIDDSLLENIFKSINDFDKFYSCFINKEDLNLDDETTIKFNKDLNMVEIFFKHNKYLVDEFSFGDIIKDFSQELEQQKQQEIVEKRKIQEIKKVNEIKYIGNHIHRIDISYINDMYARRIDNSTISMGGYYEKIRELKKIFNIGHSILIDKNEIKTIEDFGAFLTEKGFQNIMIDFQKDDIYPVV
jgi:hypothetical protein